jgi:hypothetical protein
VAPIPAFPSRPPNRFYFLFGTPIVTQKKDVADLELTERQYKELKAGVTDGITYLLKKREGDPYKDFLPRVLYEASWGGKSQAPTFKP